MTSFSKIIFLVISLLIICDQCFTQVSDSLFELSCQHEDIIILDENMEVNFIGEKIYLMMVNIKSNLTFVVKTENGLSDFQPFQLPKKFDELYIHHAPAIRNTDWNYDDIHVQEFTAYRISKDGKQTKMPVRKSVSKKECLMTRGFFGYTNIYDYYFDDLKIGDTIELTFDYDVAFKDNWLRLLSNRMFFHGEYPKKKYHLKWCYNINLEVDSVFINHDIPEVVVEGKKLCYNWTFRNLTGCLDEPESRPYKTLPHFIFVPKPYDLEYTPFNSYEFAFIPIYFFEANFRQEKLKQEQWDNIIGNKNKNNLYYQKVADKIIANATGDTIGTVLMRYFQQYMVDSVNYKDASDYYNHLEDYKKERPGVELYGYSVNDNNIERVYGNMVPKLGMDLFTAFPVDKRCGEINQYYNSTITYNDLLIATMLNNNNLGLSIPKSDKNHYYFEELPFYYENIPVLLLHFVDWANPVNNSLFPQPPSLFMADNSLLDRSTPGPNTQVRITDEWGKRNFNTEFREWITPSSELKDNYRKVQSQVKIDIENKTAIFKTRVILSGQYSTLTRCVYFDKPIDSTINKKYFDPIWNVSENVKLINIKPQHPLTYYPYKTTINMDYEARKMIKKTDGKYILDPGSWFKFIFSEEVGKEARFLDCYPDFVGFDSYSYMLEFDEPVKLISNTDTIIITNNYSHLNFIVAQTEMNKILVNCNYVIKARMVEKDSIELVNEINRAIESINQKEIIFEMADHD